VEGVTYEVNREFHTHEKLEDEPTQKMNTMRRRKEERQGSFWTQKEKNVVLIPERGRLGGDEAQGARSKGKETSNKGSNPLSRKKKKFYAR